MERDYEKSISNGYCYYDLETEVNFSLCEKNCPCKKNILFFISCTCCDPSNRLKSKIESDLFDAALCYIMAIPFHVLSCFILTNFAATYFRGHSMFSVSRNWAKLQNLFVVSISDNKLYHFNHNIHHRGNPYKRMLQISIAIKSVALIS